MNYRKKHLSPKLKRLKPKKLFFKKPVFLTILAGLAISSGIYAFLFSNILVVQKINITGNQKTAAAEIQTAAWPETARQLISFGPFNVSTKNIFLVNRGNIQAKVLESFPIIASVKVQKKLHEINLQISERQANAIFCVSAGECFHIDGTGVIFEPASYFAGLPTITSDTAGNRNLGTQVVKSAYMVLIAAIAQNLRNNFQIKVETVRVDNPMVLGTNEGWSLYVDPSADGSAQIAKLNALLKEKLPKDSRDNLEYIYLQYQDRAYYK